MIMRGTEWSPLRSFRKKRLAACVSSALHQDIQHVAILIHCSPEGVGLPVDFEKNLIQMPGVSQLAATFFQRIGRRLPEFQTPLPNRFIRDHYPTLSHHLFTSTKAEREAEIQPDNVADDFRRKVVTFGVESSDVRFDEEILA
jgi:hypothetical protein